MEEQYKKFYETDTWKEAYQLQKEIFLLTIIFPRHEQYGLTCQLNRSANSVLANLAEAHGRFHYADKIRILYIVRGEIEEAQSHLIVAASRKYISCERSASVVKHYEQLKIKINNYISSLSRQKKDN